MNSSPLTRTPMHRIAHSAQDLQGKASAILLAAPVSVGTLIGRRRQELLQQVAMPQMHFHAVETGRQKILCGDDMTLHNAIHVVPIHRVRHGRRRGPANRRRTPANRALEVARHLPAEVNDLPEDGNTLAMHRVGDSSERLDAIGVVTVDPLRPSQRLA